MLTKYQSITFAVSHIQLCHCVEYQHEQTLLRNVIIQGMFYY